MTTIFHHPARLLVTGYTDPDLDGTACAVAYAELLRLEGAEAVAGLFGAPQREARFVLQRYGVAQPPDAEELIDACDGVVLVDASDTRGISPRIDPARVVELIDHRPLHDAAAFPNAVATIEPVGAAATIVADRFRAGARPIGSGSAALLYHAIASNTVAFQAGVTTDADRAAAAWLRQRFDGEPCVDEMFADKSRNEGSLEQAFDPVFGAYPLGGLTIGIVQREAIDVRRFVDQRLDEIERALDALRNTRGVDAIFLTCVDVRDACNVFVAFDAPARELLEAALGLRFEGPVAHRRGVLLRKEILPRLAAAVR